MGDDQSSSKRPGASMQESGAILSPKRPRPSPPQRFCPIKLFATDMDLEQRLQHASDQSHWSKTECWTLREMLGLEPNPSRFTTDVASIESIDWIVICNYMVDFDFLLQEVPELVSVPGVFFYGYAETSWIGWQRAAAAGSYDFVQLDPTSAANSVSNPLPQRIPYGVHHTKLFLVGYHDGTLRVIVHTANLRPTDMRVKAQAAYLHDFARKTEEPDFLNTCEFEDTLVDYIDTYSYRRKRDWSRLGIAETLSQHLRRYDFGSARAVLIPSTPGYHDLSAAQPRRLRGHLKLRQAIAAHTPDDDGITATKRPHHRPIVCQFSSMGSLTEKYLRELQSSMDVVQCRRAAGNVAAAASTPPLSLKIVYPTVEEVRNSVQGYVGGQSVPGTLKNVSKPFLRPLYHRWTGGGDSRDTNDGRAMYKPRNIPHIKTYHQIIRAAACDDDGAADDALAWFVVCSQNLSKAAWGEVQQSSRHGGQKRLFVRHWELGVLITPSLLGADKLVPWTSKASLNLSGRGDVIMQVPLPYAAHPRKYEGNDRPWAVDQRYTLPDGFGQTSASM